MTTLESFLKEIEAFCRFADISESTFGRRFANSGKFVARLRDGADLNVGTLDRARSYMVEQRATIIAERKRLNKLAA